MSSLVPKIPYSNENFQKINKHLLSLQRKKSSTFWESRRHDQHTVPSQDFGLLEISGLYKSSAVKPSLLTLTRSKRFPLWIHFKPRHHIHRTYRRRYSSQIPQKLKDHFSEYDLSKAWYVLDIMERFQIKPKEVLEIGGGVGLVGLAIRSKIHDVNYVDIDLNEMLPSATMLALMMELPNKLELIEDGFKVGNSKFINNANLPNTIFDVGINMTSFQEMDNEQISEYMTYLSSAIRPGGFFISINRDTKISHELKLHFSHKEIPWPSEFKEIYSEESIFSKYSGRKITISTKVLINSEITYSGRGAPDDFN